jgi:hypothetical protein
MKITELRVLGDTDTVYTITATVEGVKCSCPAFRFSTDADCKHIRFVKSQLVSN